MKFSASVTGSKDLDRIFKHLATSGQKKIGRSILNGMLTEISRGVRNAVPPKLQSVKRTIGRVNKKNKRKNVHEAKVGFGVGKQRKSKKQRDPKKPGVGISKQNVHWLILGTKERRQKTTYHPTGKLKKAPDWLKQGYQAAESSAFSKAQEIGRKKVLEEIRRI